RLTYHSARTPEGLAAAPPGPLGPGAALSSTHTENGTSAGAILSTPRPRQAPSTLIRVGASARGRNRALTGTSCGSVPSHPTMRVSPVRAPPANHRAAPSGPSRSEERRVGKECRDGWEGGR